MGSGYRIVICACAAACCAQAELYRIVANHLYGFIDSTGHVAIPPQFVWAMDFSEGLASVMICGQEGYIDETGRMAITPQFLRAYEFRDGRALVGKDGRWGFIDKTGRVVTAWYEDAEAFIGGLAAVKMGEKWGFIGRDGEVRIPAQFDFAGSFVNGMRAIVTIGQKDFLIDRSGKIISSDPETVLSALSDGGVRTSADGVVFVRVSDSEWGYASREGKILWRSEETPEPHRPLDGWSDEEIRKSCQRPD